MRKFSLYILTVIVLSSFMVGDNGDQYRHIPNNSFEEGEVIEYKAHYGFINAAEGKMIISDKIHMINDRPCYKIDVYGKSIGMFDVFLRIRDNWGTYLDTSAIISHKFYRIIEEGKYRKKEVVDFDQLNHTAKVHSFDNKKQQWRAPRAYEIPSNVQDLVSGYYYIRTLDFKPMKIGDIISTDAFFDDEAYNFDIRFVGREELKTKLGVIRAVVFSPIMPENSLFDGENSVKIWISDDFNKVPLKIKANMFVGAVEIDITNYQKRSN